MSKFFIVLGISLASALGISGCGSRGETIGTVGGAVGGGAVGSAATGGSTVGTVGGAAAGGIIGHELGERYEDRHNRSK
jgi:osmotically inducible lipoprotein OsmB